MNGHQAPRRPDGYLWCGRLLHAALEPASRVGPRARPRKQLPAFRVMFALVREDLDADGNGLQPLYNLAVTTTLALGYLITEAARHYDKDPEEVATGLAGQLITANAGRVLAALYDDSYENVLRQVLTEGTGEGFFDLLGDLAELAATLLVGVADKEGVEPGDIVDRLQRIAEDSC